MAAKLLTAEELPETFFSAGGGVAQRAGKIALAAVAVHADGLHCGMSVNQGVPDHAQITPPQPSPSKGREPIHFQTATLARASEARGDQLGNDFEEGSVAWEVSVMARGTIIGPKSLTAVFARGNRYGRQKSLHERYASAGAAAFISSEKSADHFSCANVDERSSNFVDEIQSPSSK